MKQSNLKASIVKGKDMAMVFMYPRVLVYLKPVLGLVPIGHRRKIMCHPTCLPRVRAKGTGMARVKGKVIVAQGMATKMQVLVRGPASIALAFMVKERAKEKDRLECLVYRDLVHSQVKGIAKGYLQQLRIV